MIEVVEAIVRNLVDNPDEVEVTEESDGRHVTYLVRVADGDRGNVIGRGGSTVNALRTLLDGLGQRRRLRVDLDLVED